LACQDFKRKSRLIISEIDPVMDNLLWHNKRGPLEVNGRSGAARIFVEPEKF
jgi:hypothetical protein